MQVSGQPQLLARDLGVECLEDAELIAFGVGHDRPRNGVGLTDVDPTGAKRLRPCDRERLIVRAQVDVDSVLDLLGLGNAKEEDVR